MAKQVKNSRFYVDWEFGEGDYEHAAIYTEVFTKDGGRIYIMDEIDSYVFIPNDDIHITMDDVQYDNEFMQELLSDLKQKFLTKAKEFGYSEEDFDFNDDFDNYT